MTQAILFTSSLLVVLLSLALVREIRIRRALERLLARLLTLWRTRHAKVPSDRTRHAGPVDDDRRL